MAIFPVLETEKVVQVGDKTRLEAMKSFVSKGEVPVSKVEIKPEASGSYVEVTGANSKDWFLDWIYETPGTKTATIKITTTLTPTPVETTKDFTLEVLSVVVDDLFTNDQDLTEYESDILKYVRPGRNSWLDYHRKAKELIVDFMNKRGSRDSDGQKLTGANFKDHLEVKQWSCALTLQLITSNLSNAVDDIFDRKSKIYGSMVSDARSRLFLVLDQDGDSTVESGEGVFMESGRLLRR